MTRYLVPPWAQIATRSSPSTDRSRWRSSDQAACAGGGRSWSGTPTNKGSRVTSSSGQRPTRG